MQSYFRKLYALRLLAAGREEEAYLQAVAYVVGHIPIGASEADERRRSEVIVQESYVLAHEFMHALFRHDPGASAILADSCLALISFGADVRDSGMEDKVDEDGAKNYATNMLRDLNTQFIRGGGRPEDIDWGEASRVWTGYCNAWRSPEPYAAQVDALKVGSPGLREEVVCDALAAMLAGRVADSLGFSQVESLTCVLLGLHNVRLLRQLDAWAALGPNPKIVADVDAAISETQIRVTMFRLFSEGLASYDESGFNEHELADVYDSQRQLNRTFAKVLNDHALWSARREMWQLSADDPFWMDQVPDELDLHAAVRELCGF